MSRELLERKDVKEEHKWDIESMYDGFASWNEDYERCIQLGNDFLKHENEFSKSAKGLLGALKDRDELYRLMEHLYVYTNMKLDEDTRVSDSQELSDKGMRLIVEINEKTSFFIPELLTIDEEKLKAYFNENEELRLYKHHFSSFSLSKSNVIDQVFNKMTFVNIMMDYIF